MSKYIYKEVKNYIHNELKLTKIVISKHVLSIAEAMTEATL